MVGFALIHGEAGVGIPLMLNLWGGLIWLAFVAIFAAFSWSLGGVLGMSVVTAYALAWALVSTPYGFWQRMFVAKLAHGPHAAEFVQQAAALGEIRTDRAFIDAAVPVDQQDSRAGSTALHAAATGGQLAVAEFLVSRGANVNAINRYGDSPLENAESANSRDVAQFLMSHGGEKFRGSEEQRAKVISEIVRQDIKEMDRLATERNK
jgi:hypothetical protein